MIEQCKNNKTTTQTSTTTMVQGRTRVFHKRQYDGRAENDAIVALHATETQPPFLFFCFCFYPLHVRFDVSGFERKRGEAHQGLRSTQYDYSSITINSAWLVLSSFPSYNCPGINTTIVSTAKANRSTRCFTENSNHVRAVVYHPVLFKSIILSMMVQVE